MEFGRLLRNQKETEEVPPMFGTLLGKRLPVKLFVGGFGEGVELLGVICGEGSRKPSDFIEAAFDGKGAAEGPIGGEDFGAGEFEFGLAVEEEVEVGGRIRWEGG